MLHRAPQGIDRPDALIQIGRGSAPVGVHRARLALTALVVCSGAARPASGAAVALTPLTGTWTVTWDSDVRTQGGEVLRVNKRSTADGLLFVELGGLPPAPRQWEGVRR